MADSVLDHLVFQAIPLGEPLPEWPTSLSLELGALQAATNATGSKALKLGAPFFARRSPIASSDVNWPAYCGLFRDMGMLVQTSLAEVEALSDVNVPARMLARSYNEGFELNDFVSADAILIECAVLVASQKCSRLPLEINGWHELKLLVESLRQVAGPGKPIGLGMLAGDIYTDVSNALAARVDYVVLEFETRPAQKAAMDYIAWGVVAARTACLQSGHPHFPILVDAPVADGEAMVKLLALGASMVAIDTLVADAMPAAAPSSVQVPKGLLSGIGSLPVKATPNVQPVASKLTELSDRLRARLFRQHLNELSQFNREHLRALNEHAARLCNVKLLQHEP